MSATSPFAPLVSPRAHPAPSRTADRCRDPPGPPAETRGHPPRLAAANRKDLRCPPTCPPSPTAPVRFRDDVTVELVKHSASDSDVLWAARVSTAGEQSLEELTKDPERSKGLINYLMRDRHGSPFEHNSMTFFISAPIFVFREFMRHRVGWSYNEESGRYRELAAGLLRAGAGAQAGAAGPPGQVRVRGRHARAAQAASRRWRSRTRSRYAAYQEMLADGVAREVARAVLPVGLFSSMYATCNARSLMHFLGAAHPARAGQVPSFPQREIEMVGGADGGGLGGADAAHPRRLQRETDRGAPPLSQMSEVFGLQAFVKFI